MAVAQVTGTDLQVRFSAWERLAVWRRELVVPLAAIKKAERIDKPLAHTHGGRSGFLISGAVKVGTWGLGTGARQLVSIRRSTPALRVTLDRTAADESFDELLISTKNASELVELITSRQAAG